MNKLLATLFTLVLTTSIAAADQLKVTVDVASTNKTTEIIQANILASIDGKVTEIDITQDGNVPFKLNLKGGAFRLRSQYATKAQLTNKEAE